MDTVDVGAPIPEPNSSLYSSTRGASCGKKDSLTWWARKKSSSVTNKLFVRDVEVAVLPEQRPPEPPHGGECAVAQRTGESGADMVPRKGFVICAKELEEWQGDDC